MLQLALALLAACAPAPSDDPPDAADTITGPLPGDPCWGPPTHSGEADVVRIGNLRDDDTPIGFLPVEGAPVERAAVVEGRLSWATPGATDTIGQDSGRRVVLFSLSAFPRRVASVPLAAGRTPLRPSKGPLSSPRSQTCASRTARCSGSARPKPGPRQPC
jgi:hypothetical protein